MTAKGKITVKDICGRPLGTVRVLVTNDWHGRAPATGDTGPWYPAYNKRGMRAATVTDVDSVGGGRRTRYHLTTDLGQVSGVHAHQTFWLAPDDPPAADLMATGRCSICGWQNAIGGDVQTVTCAGPGCDAPVHLGDVRPAGPVAVPPATVRPAAVAPGSEGEPTYTPGGLAAEDPRGLTRAELLALTPGTAVEVLLHARTYMGPLIDPRRGWVPAAVTDAGETMNGEVNLWADVTYPAGYTGRNGSTVHNEHWTANATNVRWPAAGDPAPAVAVLEDAAPASAPFVSGWAQVEERE